MRCFSVYDRRVAVVCRIRAPYWMSNGFGLKTVTPFSTYRFQISGRPRDTSGRLSFVRVPGDLKPMKNIVPILLLCVSVTGCAAMNQSQYNSTAAEVAKEASVKCFPQKFLGQEEATAFSRTQVKKSNKNCTGWPFSKEKASEVYECSTPIWEGFKSVSSQPKAYAAYLKERQQRYADYESGKIDAAQFVAHANKEIMKYYRSVHKGSYYKSIACDDNLKKEKLLPLYGNKALMINFMADTEEYASNADKKHLSEVDFNIGINKIFAQYKQEEQEANIEAQQRNSDNLFRSLQYLQTQQIIQQQQPQYQVVPPPHLSAPINNNIHCTSTSFGDQVQTNCY